MIRSSKHSLQFANTGKKETVERFLIEYQRVGNLIINEIWGGYKDFSVQNDKLDLPKFINNKDFQIETALSARAMKCLCCQVKGMISSVTEKRRRVLWLREKMIKEGKCTKSIEKTLLKRKFTCSKPKFPIVAELNSICSNLEASTGSFDFVLKLSSLGKEFGNFYVPILGTKVSKKWSERGTRMNSFLLTKENVSIRFEVEVEEKKEGSTVGADQGKKKVLSLSDGQTTPKTDNHGHSLDSIVDKVSRKKKGSKAFQKATEHRKNFINWSINQLNLTDVKQINLEEIVNINFGRTSSRQMQAWTNTQIRDKVVNLAEEQGVLVVLQDSSFKSQRCCVCGNTRNANRKKEIYSCKHCGNVMDADLNAAKNHEIFLPDAGHLRGRKLNLGQGFFWNPDGFSTYDGRELTVPDLNKMI